MKYGFIREHQHEYPVKTMCRVVQVSVSGYYAWQHRGASERSKANAQLSKHIENVYQGNRQVDGSPRIHAVLTTQAIQCGRKRIARLMRQANLNAKPVQHRTRTTDSRHGHPVADTLLGQDFTADTPNTRMGCRYDWGLDHRRLAVSGGYSGWGLSFRRWMGDEFFS